VSEEQSGGSSSESVSLQISPYHEHALATGDACQLSDALNGVQALQRTTLREDHVHLKSIADLCGRTKSLVYALWNNNNNNNTIPRYGAQLRW
jgi:hypothetical protein